MSARSTALAVLQMCEKQNSWSDGALKQRIRRDGLDRRDAALASRLTYGVLQNKRLLDFYLSAFLRGKMSDLQPIVADILRLGAYQIILTDKIPDSAAVNESVELAKKLTNKGAAGLVNGVLRNLIRNRENLPEPPSLSVKYSHSDELTNLLRESVGEDLIEPLLASHNEAPETVLQVNTLKTDGEKLLSVLEQSGIAAKMHPYLPDCILVSGSGDLSSRDFFREGLAYVQDPAARMAVMAADIAPGFSVLDTCAAPGGKSFAAALMMQNRGKILSCDIHPHKEALIRAGAERLGISVIKTATRDARTPVPEEKYDRVICDAPCSGLGVIRKKPDIRYKDLRETEKLPALQYEILSNAASFVKPGGILLYSTCTILKRENEQVIRRFSETHGEFTAEDFSLPGNIESTNGMLTLLPCIHGTDGFFICRLRKEK